MMHFQGSYLTCYVAVPFLIELLGVCLTFFLGKATLWSLCNTEILGNSKINMLNGWGTGNKDYTLNRVVFCFPSIAPVMFNRSLGGCSSPSACHFHRALLFVLSKAVSCTSQGKVMCYDMSFGSEVCSLCLQINLWWYLGWIPWEFSLLYSFSFSPGEDCVT